MGEWGAWTPCTMPCGGGVRKRDRAEFYPGDPGVFCPGKMNETETCNNDACTSMYIAFSFCYFFFSFLHVFAIIA